MSQVTACHSEALLYDFTVTVTGLRMQYTRRGGSQGFSMVQAIQKAPRCAMLFTSRAAAYLKRDWIGDSWAALQDCETAISLDPAFSKAHWRRVHALNALGQLQVAFSSLCRWLHACEHREESEGGYLICCLALMHSYRSANLSLRPSHTLTRQENLENRFRIRFLAGFSAGSKGGRGPLCRGFPGPD